MENIKKDINSKEYARESCDICANRFNCKQVEDYDKNPKNMDLRGCPAFDDVFTK